MSERLDQLLRAIDRIVHQADVAEVAHWKVEQDDKGWPKFLDPQFFFPHAWRMIKPVSRQRDRAVRAAVWVSVCFRQCMVAPIGPLTGTRCDYCAVVLIRWPPKDLPYAWSWTLLDRTEAEANADLAFISDRLRCEMMRIYCAKRPTANSDRGAWAKLLCTLFIGIVGSVYLTELLLELDPHPQVRVAIAAIVILIGFWLWRRWHQTPPAGSGPNDPSPAGLPIGPRRPRPLVAHAVAE